MNAVQVTLLCVAAALICAVLRVSRPEMAMAVALAAGVAAVMMALPAVRAAVETVRSLADRAGLSAGHTGTILRAAGVALAAEFGAQLCADANEQALAGRIEFAARAALFWMAVPVLTEMLDTVLGAVG